MAIFHVFCLPFMVGCSWRNISFKTANTNWQSDKVLKSGGTVWEMLNFIYNQPSVKSSKTRKVYSSQTSEWRWLQWFTWRIFQIISFIIRRQAQVEKKKLFSTSFLWHTIAKSKLVLQIVSFLQYKKKTNSDYEWVCITIIISKRW